MPVFLTARRTAHAHRAKQDYLFRVHLDESKVLEDGSPDPAWVYEWTWGEEPPQGVSEQDYRAAITEQVKGLALAELSRREALLGHPRTAKRGLAIEGETF